MRFMPGFFPATLAATLAIAAPARGAVVNGDFSAGLTGFTAEACAFVCTLDPANWISIADAGGNPYLEISTGSTLEGMTYAGVTTPITISATARTLSFDARLISDLTDPGSSGTSPFVDSLSVFLFDSALNYTWIFDIESSGATVDPFANPALSGASLAAPADPLFDWHAEVDLGGFMGQAVSLGIAAFSANDGRSLRGGFDNFTLTGEPATVPLPAGLPLLLGALGLTGLLRARLRR
ncbi:hypothetical protein [Poseidonocella sedimentorum]|uniref:VPLPA-CTERM protein sorting domain-containing protein n=1 Tax=Poseidonocella sedimentorum TaxID=871652 RepID=A0A1I6EDI2_9RHOB|nr:hypothetical protein [Poseidonocella sedimentorum]SFR15717.1 hypothetical protein SAMN04515673_11038 [Poseidonocella sedimentorum]